MKKTYPSPSAEAVLLTGVDVLKNSWTVGEYDENENVFDYGDINGGNYKP